MGDDLLFVYATLRGDTGGDMHHTLARVADFVGTATFRGRLYKVRHYAGAAPSDDPKDRVHGEVYRLRDPQKILAVLDEYEGCEPSSADGEFERHETNVALARISQTVEVHRTSE